MLHALALFFGALVLPPFPPVCWVVLLNNYLSKWNQTSFCLNMDFHNQVQNFFQLFFSLINKYPKFIEKKACCLPLRVVLPSSSSGCFSPMSGGASPLLFGCGLACLHRSLGAVLLSPLLRWAALPPSFGWCCFLRLILWSGGASPSRFGWCCFSVILLSEEKREGEVGGAAPSPCLVVLLYPPFILLSVVLL